MNDDKDELPQPTWLDDKLKEWQQYVANHVAAERERCAKICDDAAAHYCKLDGLNMDFVDGEELATDLANKIRGK